MRHLTLDDKSNFHDVALYHWSGESSFEEASKAGELAWALAVVAEACGWNLHGYLDWDTGEATRPAFDRMIQDARDRKFQMILCWDVDCFGPWTAREATDAFIRFDKCGIPCCSLLSALDQPVAKKLTLSQLHDLITEDESDPKYFREAVTAKLAVRELHSAKSKRADDEKRRKGEPRGRRPRKRDALLPLFEARMPIDQIIATGKASPATAYRTEKFWLDSQRA